MPLLFEGAKRSFLAYEQLLVHLMAQLRGIELSICEKLPIEEAGADPLITATSLIDFAHRFGQLVDALPLVSKKLPQMRLLAMSLTAVLLATTCSTCETT